MSPRSSIVLIGAGLLSLSAGAMAQPAAPSADGQGKFSSATRTQLQTALEKRFDKADANHDGTLTPQERTANKTERRDDMRARMFARLDTDGNGEISKAEFTAPRPEGKAAHRRVAGSRTEHTAGRNNHRPRFAGMMMMHRQLAAYDGKPIAKADYVSAGLTMFDRIDTDHDGTISAAERDAARTANRARRAPANSPQPLPPGS